jgi:hypothetical protein
MRRTTENKGFADTFVRRAFDAVRRIKGRSTLETQDHRARLSPNMLVFGGRNPAEAEAVSRVSEPMLTAAIGKILP